MRAHLGQIYGGVRQVSASSPVTQYLPVTVAAPLDPFRLGLISRASDAGVHLSCRFAGDATTSMGFPLRWRWHRGQWMAASLPELGRPPATPSSPGPGWTGLDEMYQYIHWG